MGEAWTVGSKSLADHQQSVKHKSTTIETLWPALTLTFFHGQMNRGLFYCPNHSSCPIIKWRRAPRYSVKEFKVYSLEKIENKNIGKKVCKTYACRTNYNKTNVRRINMTTKIWAVSISCLYMAHTVKHFIIVYNTAPL